MVLDEVQQTSFWATNKRAKYLPYHAISSFGEGNSRRVHIVIQHSPTTGTTPEIHTRKSHRTTNSEPKQKPPLNRQILNALEARKKREKERPQFSSRNKTTHVNPLISSCSAIWSFAQYAHHGIVPPSLFPSLSKFLTTALFFARTKNPNSSLKFEVYICRNGLNWDERKDQQKLKEGARRGKAKVAECSKTLKPQSSAFSRRGL